MKRTYKIILILLLIVALLLLATIPFSNFIEKKITNAINNSNSNIYITNVDKVDLNLFDRSLIINSVFLGPRSKRAKDSIGEAIKNDSLEKITISSIKIEDIRYSDYLFDDFLRIGKVEVNDVIIKAFNKKKQKESDEKPVNLDSIYIDKINGFEIVRFDFNNVQYTVFDSIKHDTVFSHKPVNFNLDNFQLKKVQGQIFKISIKDKIFKINDLVINEIGEHYKLSIDEVNLNTETSDLDIKAFKLVPMEDKYALANKFKYNDPILNFDIERIHLYHIDFSKLLKKQGVFIDSILISKGNFDFYKDKRKPFNENLVKQLPHVILKELKTPVNIDHISIDNCTLKAENHFPHKNLQMKLAINQIHGKIENISNLKENENIPLKLYAQSKLMNRGILKVHFDVPMNDPKNYFYFDGSLSSSPFKYYDDIIYPALGLKVLKGNMDYLTFKAKANNYSARGTMKMLYHDLDATVYKKNSNEKSKFLSWAIKTVLHNSNPVKNKPVRVAKMYHKHDKYRGFGGYLWKTLQSGIVNTLAPTGNKTSKKADKIIEKRKRKKERS